MNHAAVRQKLYFIIDEYIYHQHKNKIQNFFSNFFITKYKWQKKLFVPLLKQKQSDQSDGNVSAEIKLLFFSSFSCRLACYSRYSTGDNAPAQTNKGNRKEDERKERAENNRRSEKQRKVGGTLDFFPFVEF